MTDDRRPVHAALDRYFTYRLNSLSKLNDMASPELYLAGGGLSLPETRCLAAIGSFPELTVNQLAFQANLDKAQASRAAQGLVSKGLVNKSASPSDGRSVTLSLTQQGKEHWPKIMAVIDERNRSLLDCLTPDEQEQLLDMFGRMIAQAVKSQEG